jgi:hypothetical protein
LADKDLTLATEDRLVFKAKLSANVMDKNFFLQVYERLGSSSTAEIYKDLQALVPEFSSHNTRVVF